MTCNSSSGFKVANRYSTRRLALVRQRIQTPSAANGPERGCTGGGGRPRSSPSGRHFRRRSSRPVAARFDSVTYMDAPRKFSRAAKSPCGDLRPRPDDGAARVGPARDDAAARSACTGRDARDGRPHPAHEVHRSGARNAARRPPRLGRAAGLRLLRGQPHPRHGARLAEGEPRSRRASGRAYARVRARLRGLGRRAQEQRLRVVPAVPAREHRPVQALRRVLRARRRAVRHPARRLRARPQDRRGATHLRLRQGASGRADPRVRRRAAGDEGPVLAPAAGAVRARGRSASSASTTAPGASIPPCIRSRREPRSTTSA